MGLVDSVGIAGAVAEAAIAVEEAGTAARAARAVRVALFTLAAVGVGTAPGSVQADATQHKSTSENSMTLWVCILTSLPRCTGIPLHLLYIRAQEI